MSKPKATKGIAMNAPTLVSSIASYYAAERPTAAALAARDELLTAADTTFVRAESGMPVETITVIPHCSTLDALHHAIEVGAPKVVWCGADRISLSDTRDSRVLVDRYCSIDVTSEAANVVFAAGSQGTATNRAVVVATDDARVVATGDAHVTARRFAIITLRDNATCTADESVRVNRS